MGNIQENLNELSGGMTDVLVLLEAAYHSLPDDPSDRPVSSRYLVGMAVRQLGSLQESMDLLSIKAYQVNTRLDQQNINKE